MGDDYYTELGADDYVTKPFDIEILVNKILYHVKCLDEDSMLSSSRINNTVEQENVDVPFEKIKGINIQEGLTRFNGDWALYQKVLLLKRPITIIPS